MWQSNDHCSPSTVSFYDKNNYRVYSSGHFDWLYMRSPVKISFLTPKMCPEIGSSAKKNPQEATKC